MLGTHFLAGVVGLAVLAEPAALVDLSQVDRSLRKEPVYESKRPQYCLLVFGPRAEPRVWIVLDGDVLYLDRNGNGDLTEPGERLLPDQNLHHPEDRPEIEILQSLILRHPLGTGEERGRSILSCRPDVIWFHVEQLLPREEFLDDPRWAYAWKRPFRVALASVSEWEQGARVAFADRAEDAPVLPFLGPQQVTWTGRDREELREGEKAGMLVHLATPGIKGTVKTYQGIPKNSYPVVDIEFPARRPGGTPIRRHAELTTPC